MSLLVILISLVLEKSLPAINRLRSLAWFEHYQHWIQNQLASRKTWQGIPSLLLIVLLPTIGIAIIQYLLDDLLTLLSFVFSIIVLTYCLGPKDEHRRVNDYLDAIEDDNRSDTDSIQNDLSEILQAGGVTRNDTDEATRINKLIESVLIITHDRMLAVLFWFVVLGPMGAVLCRLTLALLQNLAQNKTQQTTESDADEEPTTNNEEFNAAVQRLHHLLGWIPSHLTALSYAVMGSFVHGLRAWQKIEEGTIEQTDEAIEAIKTTDNEITATPTNHKLLLRIGRASLQFDSKPPEDNTAVRETLGMCGRSLVAWITILAIMTLAGWAS